jgi:hypothetical protein
MTEWPFFIDFRVLCTFSDFLYSDRVCWKLQGIVVVGYGVYRIESVSADGYFL